MTISSLCVCGVVLLPSSRPPCKMGLSARLHVSVIGALWFRPCVLQQTMPANTQQGPARVLPSPVFCVVLLALHAIAQGRKTKPQNWSHVGRMRAHTVDRVESSAHIIFQASFHTWGDRHIRRDHKLARLLIHITGWLVTQPNACLTLRPLPRTCKSSTGIRLAHTCDHPTAL